MGKLKGIDITHPGERSPGGKGGEARWVLEHHYLARRRYSGYWPRHSFSAVIKQLFDPFFLSYIALWFMVHGFRYLHYPLPYVNGWLTDFIFIPAVAHFARTCTRHILLEGRSFSYALHWLLLAALYSGLLCEWILPKFTHNTVGDVRDAFAYIGGAFFYYYVHQKNTGGEGVINSNFATHSAKQYAD